MARAILNILGMGWIEDLGADRGERDPRPAATRAAADETKLSGRDQAQRAGKKSARGSVKTKSKRPTMEVSKLSRQEIERLTKEPKYRSAVASATQTEIDARIADLFERRNYVGIGNIGEQVTLRVLERLEYQVLATESDLHGAVADIVGGPTRMNAEDFIVVSKDGRYLTVNAKAAVAARNTRILADGSLTPAKMAKGQDDVEYYSLRAGLLSPLDGALTDGQVMKVDLVHKMAQLFDIGPGGTQTSASPVIRVDEDLAIIFSRFPDQDVPAPTGPNAEPPGGGAP